MRRVLGGVMALLEGALFLGLLSGLSWLSLQMWARSGGRSVECGKWSSEAECIAAIDADLARLASCDGALEASDEVIACAADLPCDQQSKDLSETDCKDAYKVLSAALTACGVTSVP